MKCQVKFVRLRIAALFLLTLLVLLGCGGGSETEIQNNNIPVAIIDGKNKSVINEVLSLTSETSFDSDGDTLSHAWSIKSKPEGSGIVLDNSSEMSVSFTPDIIGTYEISLTVNDGKVDSLESIIETIVTINNNESPVANAGLDQGAVIGNLVTLDGLNSTDFENDNLSFNWVLSSIPNGSSVQLSSLTEASPTFTPDIIGIYEVTLAVKDTFNTSLPDVVIITARDTNKIPVANAGENQVVKPGAEVNLDGGESFDADGDALNFTWAIINRPENSTAVLTNPSAIHSSFIADIGGDYEISLTVSDGINQSEIAAVVIRTLDGGSEIEPNDDKTSAQKFIDIGLSNPIVATRDESDIDWYQFEAVSDETYIIELFDVAKTLSTTGGNNCSYGIRGLFLVVFDDLGNEVGRQCQPVGSGNVHTILTIKPTETGTHYIQVASANLASTDSGNYSIRILPSHDDARASWDAETYEPNNRSSNAYGIQLGSESSLSSSFDEQKSAFSTNRTDVDWYRFEAIEDETYVIELFDVASTLAATGGNSCAYGIRGLTLIAFDANNNELGRQCQPIGAGNVHTILTIEPTETGVVYIQVASANLASKDDGNYSIRVLSNQDNSNAYWDAETLEPNNRSTNAYEIQLGAEYFLNSNFDKRRSPFATNRADVDWYRFEAVEDKTYIIELFNVASTLAATGGNSCAYGISGLTVNAFDSNGNELDRQCQPIGAGNVHTILTIKPTETGTHYIQVASANLASADDGTYSIRVLPDHDHANASWNSLTFEPNNSLFNAYKISLGEENSSGFDVRRSIFSTNRADVDWYRVDAIAYQVYVIELFDVESSLIASGGNSCAYGMKGLSLIVFDSRNNELERQCQPIGVDNIHNTLEFTPTIDGVFYIQVASNSLGSNDNGSYKIRINLKE